MLTSNFLRINRVSTHRRASALAISLCIAAAGTLAATAVFPAQAQAKVVNPYGTICAQYESGSNPGSVVSGSAYGAYQMSTYNAHAFADWLKTHKKGSKTYQYGSKLATAYKKDGNRCGSHFDAAWKALAAKYADSFHRYQYLYMKKTHYTVTANYLKQNVKNFKLSKYSSALKNAVFSTSIQHGAWGGYHIVAKAFEDLNGDKKRPAESELISEIYQVRAAYKPALTVKKMVASPGQAVYSISTGNTQYYVSNGLLSAKQAKKLKGEALVNFYSCTGATQVGVFYRLTVSENNAVQALL